MLLSLAGCNDPDGARDALDGAGYRDIQIVDRPNWFISNCGEKDTYATHFKALGPTGATVDGVVCSTGGWSKGSTIRITGVHRPEHWPTAPQSGARP
ncbi:hypothetical protein MGN01_17030 [Methylobacterium gnaphalii]|uniref:Uncharacterized protein n=1 Tax=Methylobacterium gnaphalii TaxID=1010610 RepID=A0A512JIR8_9HYPH|nr:hypothetical protein MGN01_17030 [Methylobacterium gnaphalii]GLS49887.1 hypothetical protein GCM10007885_27390 [Methylobacterium gnaphalii]